MNKNKFFGWILILFPIFSIFFMIGYKLYISGLYEVIVIFIIFCIVVFMILSGIYLISKD